MPVCAKEVLVTATGRDPVTLSDGSPALVLALDPSHTNLATCTYVIQVGGSLLPADELLDAEHLASAWSASFGIVILCYLIARAVGVCLELIRKG